MLHRTKKEGDENRDKWIGIGGKFEEKESPEDCLLREVKEETGLELLSWRYRGIITFVSDRWPTEYMHLFTAEKFGGRLKSSEECREGELCWIDKKAVYDLALWEGDRIFLRLLDTEESFFSLKLEYAGERLVQAVKNGRILQAPREKSKREAKNILQKQ